MSASQFPHRQPTTARSGYSFGLRAAVVLLACGSGVNHAQQPSDNVAPSTVKPTNVVVRISRNALLSAIAQNRNETSQVRENMFGTMVTGIANTQSNVTTSLVPNRNEIAIELKLNTETDSKTVGTKGAARVHTNATTNVEATKLVTLTTDGWALGPTQTTGITQSRITQVQWQRLVGYNAAVREAQAQKPKMDREASRRAQRRVKQRVDADLIGQINSVRDMFEQSFRRPLLQRDLLTDEYDLMTTADAIGIGVVIAHPISVRPPEEPLSPDHDVVVALHETLFNNTLQEWLGSQTLRERSWAETFPQRISFLDSALRPADPENEWSITFDEDHPITVDFAARSMNISLNASEFAIGEKRYPAATISVAYDLSDPRSVVATRRDEKIRITFPETNPTSSEPLGVRRQVFRSLLRKRFEPLFLRQWEIQLADLLPHSQLPELLELEKIAMDREWLLLHYGLNQRATESVR